MMSLSRVKYRVIASAARACLLWLFVKSASIISSTVGRSPNYWHVSALVFKWEKLNRSSTQSLRSASMPVASRSSPTYSTATCAFRGSMITLCITTPATRPLASMCLACPSDALARTGEPFTNKRTVSGRRREKNAAVSAYGPDCATVTLVCNGSQLKPPGSVLMRCTSHGTRRSVDRSVVRSLCDDHAHLPSCVSAQTGSSTALCSAVTLCNSSAPAARLTAKFSLLSASGALSPPSSEKCDIPPARPSTRAKAASS
mmetsp:Transcript_25104/g.63731  ORF Transcript_25104/g.63731 Transcript_25104/m.63731 type:complete len:258 (-) Transcript_25104:2107-2880(-)